MCCYTHYHTWRAISCSGSSIISMTTSWNLPLWSWAFNSDSSLSTSSFCVSKPGFSLRPHSIINALTSYFSHVVFAREQARFFPAPTQQVCNPLTSYYFAVPSLCAMSSPSMRTGHAYFPLPMQRRIVRKTR